MILISLVLLFIGIIINFIDSDGHPGVYIGTLIACIGAMIFAASRYETNPSAMDVYQGKTTLEITYKDGVLVDSNVVFKNENE